MGPGAKQSKALPAVLAAVPGVEDAAVGTIIHPHAQGRGQRETPQTGAGLLASSWGKQSTAAEMPVPHVPGKATWKSRPKAARAAPLVLPHHQLSLALLL